MSRQDAEKWLDEHGFDGAQHILDVLDEIVATGLDGGSTQEAILGAYNERSGATFRKAVVQ